MKEKLKSVDWRHVARPLVYLFLSRFLISLCVFLLICFFLETDARPNLKPWVFPIGGFAFLLLAWICYLRMDGIHLPRIFMHRVNIKRRPVRTYGDIIDHIDDIPIVHFEDLEDADKDVCILFADLACCIVYFVLTFIF